MTNPRVVSRNLPFLKQQLSALLGTTSLSVKCICLVIFLCYFLSYSEFAVLCTTITPAYIFSRFWTLFTHCFVEFHLWEVCVDIITVGLCGKLIEPLWGAWEMMKFFALVNFCSGILSTFFYMVLYMATQNTEVLFDIHIHGLAGYLAAVAVAVKQMMPDHVLLRTPLGKLTNRNVPLCVSLVSIPLWLIGILEGTYPTMFMSGVLISWIYLRFYQKHSNGTRGDMADNFTFASFFPNVLQPPMEMVASALYSLLIRLKICRKPVRKYDVGAPTAITISLPGTEPQDAERRRQIALKALSERLSKSDTQPSWPSLEARSPPPPALPSTSSAGSKLGSRGNTAEVGKPSHSNIVAIHFEGDKNTESTAAMKST